MARKVRKGATGVALVTLLLVFGAGTAWAPHVWFGSTQFATCSGVTGFPTFRGGVSVDRFAAKGDTVLANENVTGGCTVSVADSTTGAQLEGAQGVPVTVDPSSSCDLLTIRLGSGTFTGSTTTLPMSKIEVTVSGLSLTTTPDSSTTKSLRGAVCAASAIPANASASARAAALQRVVNAL